MNPSERPPFIPSTISRVNPEEEDDIAAYYQFEVDQGFSQINPKTNFDDMVNFRQRQLRDHKLEVAMIKDGDKVVATTIVVLENGTMGKQIQDGEAWAAGTLVLPEKRGLGIGEKMSEEQDKIAKEAGRNSILTAIASDNYPSMRLRMKVGYRLEKINKRNDKIDYIYRKDLATELPGDKSWKEKAEADNLKIFTGEINGSSPKEILVDPNNDQQIQDALSNNYQGIYLLRPEDFTGHGQIDSNLIVFVRKTSFSLTDC